MEHKITAALLEEFRTKMKKEEKSSATIEKYMHDIRCFGKFLRESGEGAAENQKSERAEDKLPEEAFDKEKVIAYKQYLVDHYASASVNSMLAAVNTFFKENGWYDCVVKSLKIQKETFRSSERELTKEEYMRLLRTAARKGNQRLYLLMQTICSTGIRVSELPYITVEALYTRRAVVSLKGKTRIVILPKELCRELMHYIKEKNIQSGSIFITRNGNAMNRSNIWKEMKELCREAGIGAKKVFPHNLRHLFACTYYRLEKDITHLADILGHSNINTTRIYTLVSGEEQEKRIELLGLVV